MAKPSDVVVVGIDDVTFQETGLQSPFPRSVHAKVIDRLTAAGAKVIAEDIQYTEPTTAMPGCGRPCEQLAEDEDAALAEAVYNAGQRGSKVVLSTTEVAADGSTYILGGNLRVLGARAGNGSYIPDSDGVIRRFPYQIDLLETFPVVAAERALGHTLDPSTFPEKRAWIDFTPPGTVPYLSFSQVLTGKFDPADVRGRTVVVGGTAAVLQDVHATSTSGEGVISGAEIQANAIHTVLQGFPLGARPSGWTCSRSGSSHWRRRSSGSASLRCRRSRARPCSESSMRPQPRSRSSTGRSSRSSFPWGRSSSPRSAGSGSTTCSRRSTGSAHATPSRASCRRTSSTRCSRGRAGDFAWAAFASSERACSPTCAARRMFAESLPPETVVEVINRYLGELTEAILGHGGTLISYLGDGFMAVFGAPIPQDDHADRAIAAAREILAERLPRFNEWLREQGYGEDFTIGIGINTGPFMAGTSAPRSGSSTPRWATRSTPRPGSRGRRRSPASMR